MPNYLKHCGLVAHKVMTPMFQMTILTAKRAEDKARIKEMEKYKIQITQFADYKKEWSSAQVRRFLCSTSFFIFFISFLVFT